MICEFLMIYNQRGAELVIIISYPASPRRIIVLLKTLRQKIDNRKKKVKERNAALEKTKRKESFFL